MMFQFWEPFWYHIFIWSSTGYRVAQKKTVSLKKNCEIPFYTKTEKGKSENKVHDQYSCSWYFISIIFHNILFKGKSNCIFNRYKGMQVFQNAKTVKKEKNIAPDGKFLWFI